MTKKADLIRVFTGDPGSYDSPSWGWSLWRHVEVYGAVTPRVLAIHLADVLDAIQGQPHGNLTHKDTQNFSKMF